MAGLSANQQSSAFAQRAAKRKKRFPQFEHFPKTLAEEQLQQRIVQAATTNLCARKLSADQQSVQISVAPLAGLRCCPVPALTNQIRGFNPETGLSELPEIELLVKSPVLAQPTIWQTCWEHNKTYYTSPQSIFDSGMEVFVAEWPSEREYKYEGDDRIRTSLEHRRFLPVPRKRTNATVNWSMLPFLQQHELDKVCQAPSHEQVLWNYYESGFEDVGEDQIRNWIGEDLYSRLVPDENTIW